jgi:hypothetical protein
MARPCNPWSDSYNLIITYIYFIKHSITPKLVFGNIAVGSDYRSQTPWNLTRVLYRPEAFYGQWFQSDNTTPQIGKQ